MIAPNIVSGNTGAVQDHRFHLWPVIGGDFRIIQGLEDDGSVCCTVKPHSQLTPGARSRVVLDPEEEGMKDRGGDITRSSSEKKFAFPRSTRACSWVTLFLCQMEQSVGNPEILVPGQKGSL